MPIWDFHNPIGPVFPSNRHKSGRGENFPFPGGNGSWRTRQQENWSMTDKNGSILTRKCHSVSCSSTRSKQGTFVGFIHCIIPGHWNVTFCAWAWREGLKLLMLVGVIFRDLFYKWSLVLFATKIIAFNKFQKPFGKLDSSMNHGTQQWGRPLETFFEIHLKLQQSIKLDGVGPVINRPSPHYIHHFEKERKNVTPVTWHLTPDTWYLIPDTWHLTCDTGHVTNCGGWTFPQNVSSPALMVWDSQCLEDSELKDDVINE